MRIRMIVIIIAAYLTGFAGMAMAETQINIAIVTNPDLVHTRAANWFKEEIDKALPGKYDDHCPPFGRTGKRDPGPAADPARHHPDVRMHHRPHRGFRPRDQGPGNALSVSFL